YTGEEQTATLTNIGEHYTVTGNKQTNAGTYKVTVKLNDDKNYTWTDGTNVELSLDFVINAVKVEKPVITGTYTYTGEEQTATLTNIGEHYTVTGNKQTNAGTYKVTVKLNDYKNYTWTD
ncbi:MAG: hypothetical protein IJX17_03325, partial [Clostridia bacterium]|nr:hypothetical protein [Clostridia bacterium]